MIHTTSVSNKIIISESDKTKMGLGDIGQGLAAIPANPWLATV